MLNENGEIKRQADMLIKNAEAVGDNEYSVYYECESGLNQNRAEFQRLMVDIKENKFKRLYIRDISRLTRDYITNQYTYKFLDNDNTVLKEATIDYGIVITPPEMPADKDLYTFDYWTDTQMVRS